MSITLTDQLNAIGGRIDAAADSVTSLTDLLEGHQQIERELESAARLIEQTADGGHPAAAELRQWADQVRFAGLPESDADSVEDWKLELPDALVVLFDPPVSLDD